MKPKMTLEQAIKVLESSYHLDCKVTEAIAELEARVIAVEALEKQVPKKPEIEQDDIFSDCYECPACGGFIGYVYDCKESQYQLTYCAGCGQAIDWEEGEADA